jgi:GTP-binding protein
MLVDEIKLTLKGGDGGAGKMSFGKMMKSGPDGGNGGDGGALRAIASSDLTLLSQFHPDEEVLANDGNPGESNKKSGKKGADRVLKLPIGTEIKDLKTGETFELTDLEDEILLCEGGEGGIGNWELRSSTNTTPKNTIPATLGQTREVKLTLRFIADYGLVGLPSAGKSSLLNELTNARVKTAAYHFTTLSPNLGVLPNKKIMADIPGLIEGAHKGRGLGVKFLKHIEKVGLLLHCVPADSENPTNDYEVIRKELGAYSKSLLKKKEIILLTKSDLLSEDEVKEKLKILKKLKKEVVSVSIHDEDSILALLKLL